MDSGTDDDEPWRPARARLSAQGAIARFAVVAVCAAALTHAPSARADHEYVWPALIGAPTAVLASVPLIGNALELADGDGSPYGWTITGLIAGTAALLVGHMHLAEGFRLDSQNGLLLGVGSLLVLMGAADIVLSILGMVHYQPPSETPADTRAATSMVLLPAASPDGLSLQFSGRF